MTGAWSSVKLKFTSAGGLKWPLPGPRISWAARAPANLMSMKPGPEAPPRAYTASNRAEVTCELFS